LLADYEALVTNSPEYAQVNQARVKAGKAAWSPEEFITTNGGMEYLQRNLGLKGETPLKTWWKDFWSHEKVAWGKANEEDFRRLLNYRFQYDAPIKGSDMAVNPAGAGTANLSDDSQLPPAEGYRYVNLKKADGSTEQVMFDDKFYKGFPGGDRASIARWVNGKISHGAAAKGETIEEIVPKTNMSEESQLGKGDRDFYLNAPRQIKTLKSGPQDKTTWEGTLANRVSPIEMELYKQAGLDEYLSSGKRSSDDVANWMEANGPKVKVESYGMQGKVSEAQKQYDEALHWLDTNKINGLNNPDSVASRHAFLRRVATNRERYYPDLTDEQLAKVEILDKLDGERFKQENNGLRATSAYDTVSPLPTNEPMPEWTKSRESKNVQRVDVVMPLKRVNEGPNPMYEVLWEKDNLHENLPNTLGWAMIQYKTGPKGEKIALIAEAQSRWGQVAREKQRVYNEKAKAAGHTPIVDINSGKTGEGHPLLRDYNRLILKAAIDQARKEGATHIMVSDMPSAMMTEHLDSAARHIEKKFDTEAQAEKELDLQFEDLASGDYSSPEVVEESGKWYVRIPKETWQALGGVDVLRNQGYMLERESGFRFNYDDQLPKIASELTGSKGERISLGEHKNTVEKDKYGNTPAYDETSLTQQAGGRYRQNLIFKNADGTPKTDVSGTLYDISKTASEWSLTGKKFSEDSQLPTSLSDKLRDIASKDFDESYNEQNKLKADISKALELKGGYALPDKAPLDLVIGDEESNAWLRSTLGDLDANTFIERYDKMMEQAQSVNKNRMVAAEQERVNPVLNSEDSQLESGKQSFAPFLTARYDKVAEKLNTDSARYATKRLKQFEEDKDFRTGKYGNSLIAATADYSPEEIARVYRHAHQMDDTGKSIITLNGREQKLADKITELLRVPRLDQNKEGLKVKAGNEYRAGGIKPEGYMFNVLDQNVPYTWAEKPTSAEAKQYEKLYVDHLVKKGMSPEDAQSAFNELKGALGDTHPISNEFPALRKAEGMGLPWELVEKNFNKASLRYAKRAARDIAYFKYLQNDPKARKVLNLRDQYGSLPDKDTAPEMQDHSDSQEVKLALRSVNNAANDAVLTPRLNALNRAAANTVMGIGTALRNVSTMPAFAAPYVTADQVPLIKKAVSQLSESRARAFQSNAVKAQTHDFDAAGFNLDSPDPVIRLFDKYSRFMRKYSGRDLSDKMEGEVYYSLGELLASDNVAKAINGDAKAKKFVERFGQTVEGGAEGLLKREVSQEDISRMAKAFVDATRGTYGPAGLPSWAIEGSIAPLFQLGRFNIEKANTTFKDVFKPVKDGNYAPLVKYALASIGVGLTIEQLNELLSNKRGSEPTTKEVYKAGSREDELHKFISLMQMASFAGIISDGAKVASNMRQGKSTKYSNPASMPLYTLVTDTVANNFSQFGKAINEGADPYEATAQLVASLATQSIQTLRYIDAHAINPDEAKRKEKFRDYAVWQDLTGRKEPGDIVPSNPYLNKDIKKFKRSDDVGEAAKMIPDLISQAVKKSRDSKGNLDVARLDKELRGLKANSFQVFPALERDPKGFSEYYEFLRETQGVDEAKSRLTEFLRQREVNKIKSELVPSL